MPRFLLSTALAAFILVAGLPVQAGTVQVSFAGADRYADTGRHTMDREQTLRTLEAHFTALATRLPEGRTLQITVTDVDLAGELDWRRATHDLRVLRGRADWPQIRLSYALREGEKTLDAGEAHLSDASYLMFSGNLDRRAALPYEKRMIDRWFQDTFAPAH